jgi:hypothetical protein
MPDDFEMQMDTTAQNDISKNINMLATQTLRRVNIHKDSNPVLVSARAWADKPTSDYSPWWLVLVHVGLFPFGDGVRPASMSLEDWVKCLLQRGAPYTKNVHFQLDAFNIIQRHRVNHEAWVQIHKIERGKNASIFADLTPAEVEATIELMTSGYQGWHMAAALKEASSSVRALFSSFKLCNARVVGSPQAMGTVRSNAIAMCHHGGSWTMALNINPSEINSHIALSIAGHNFTFDTTCAEGRPVGRASLNERYRIIANDPDACAQFFRLFLSAFCEVRSPHASCCCCCCRCSCCCRGCCCCLLW